MAKVTKNRKSLAEKLGENMKLYAVDDALQALRDLKVTKFDETVEVAHEPGRRSAPRRPDGPRHGFASRRHRQDHQGRRVRQG